LSVLNVVKNEYYRLQAKFNTMVQVFFISHISPFLYDVHANMGYIHWSKISFLSANQYFYVVFLFKINYESSMTSGHSLDNDWLKIVYLTIQISCYIQLSLFNLELLNISFILVNECQLLNIALFSLMNANLRNRIFNKK